MVDELPEEFSETLGNNQAVGILGELNDCAKGYGLRISDFYAEVLAGEAEAVEGYTLSIELHNPEKREAYQDFVNALKAISDPGKDTGRGNPCILKGSCEELLDAIENATPKRHIPSGGGRRRGTAR